MLKTQSIFVRYQKDFLPPVHILNYNVTDVSTFGPETAYPDSYYNLQVEVEDGFVITKRSSYLDFNQMYSKELIEYDDNGELLSNELFAYLNSQISISHYYISSTYNEVLVEDEQTNVEVVNETSGISYEYLITETTFSKIYSEYSFPVSNYSVSTQSSTGRIEYNLSYDMVGEDVSIKNCSDIFNPDSETIDGITFIQIYEVFVEFGKKYESIIKLDHTFISKLGFVQYYCKNIPINNLKYDKSTGVISGEINFLEKALFIIELENKTGVLVVIYPKLLFDLT